MKTAHPMRITWKSFKDSSEVLFRALGLHLILVGLKSLRRVAVGRGFDEPTKIAIRKSRKVALLRALIHVVPVGVALWEITFNWNTYYVGSNVQNQALYQFGAKLHEMTAQASIAAVVFSYVRYELSLGQGLPFGALFSGLQVSQASYLWSTEFWGSIYSTSIPSKRKMGMAVMIIVAIFLAATVGPSSAILLIPRLEYWPAGSTDIWINATAAELWPNVTNSSTVPLGCNVSDLYVVNSECPSNGWQAVKTYLDFENNLAKSYSQLGLLFAIPANYIETTGKNSLRRLSLATTGIATPGYDPQATLAFTQQAAVADALTATGVLWNLAILNVTTKGHGHPEDQLDAVHSITQEYYQPYTLASCSPDVVNGRNDPRPVAFPLPPGSDPSMLNVSAFNDSILPGYPTSLFSQSYTPSHSLEFLGITRSEILDTPGPLDENRLRWVALPNNPFNGTAIGAIVLLPNVQNDTIQQIVVCNLAAGWGASTLNISTFAGAPQTVLSAVSIKEADLTTGSIYVTSYAEGVALAADGYFSLPIYPQRTVTVTEEWAEYLNPSIPSLNTTLFHHLMASNTTSIHIASTVKSVLAGLLANGLSSLGSTSTVQGTIKQVSQPDGSFGIDGNYWFSGKGNIYEVDPNDSKDWVRFHVNSVIQGYAYSPRGAIPKLVICLLMIYCAFAVAHILYAGISGISSTCWDSIAEVTALAVNSPPTKALRNTCAGITEFDIFKLPVRVLTMRDDEGDGEHLELVFGSVDEKSVEHRVIKANRVYGTMPSMKPREKME